MGTEYRNQSGKPLLYNRSMPRFITRAQLVQEIPVDRTRFPFTLPVFRDFEEIDFHPRVTFFVGENGSGKSTMLEAVAVAAGLPAEGGSKMHRFSTHDTHSDFFDSLTIVRGEFPADTFFLRAESFYNLATYLQKDGLYRYGDIHHVSHGQGFLEAIMAFKPHGLYLFDEPESALSPQGQFTLLARMKELVDLDSQLIIATHSPILLGYGDALIYEFSDEGIREVKYRETQAYLLTRDFIANRDRYGRLLGLDPLPD